jgi:multidrug efflux pump
MDPNNPNEEREQSVTKWTDVEKMRREFKPATIALNNSTSVFIVVLLIIMMGVFAYSSMPRESFPEVVQPTIYVGTIYPGNSAVDIENLITRPLEKEINGLTGIRNLTSTSIQDYSTIIVEFNPDKDVKEALQEVKDAVDKAKPNIPKDLDTDPDIFELDFSQFPIMNVNLSGDMPMSQLKKYAEYLEDEFEKIAQVSEVDIRGLIDQEINIEVDPFKMESLEISYRDIETAVTQENITMSGGDLLVDGIRRNIRVAGELKDIAEFEGIIIKREFGNIVYLRDIAKVSFGYKDTDSYARLDGLPVVTLDIKKQAGENIIAAADQIKAIIAKAEGNTFPSNLNISITADMSKQTNQMVSDLENNIVTAVILVVVVLMLFLGIRNALIVGTAIPLSMMLGFIITNAMGITLNMMVLFSLILALGMFIDNAIVIVENIYRHYLDGRDKLTASRLGVGEVAMPIISSTATNLVAFAPLLFWDSIMGEFMKYLPLTLIIVLSSSLFVALIINPVITSRFMKHEELVRVYKNSRFWTIVAVFLVLGFPMVILGTGKVPNKMLTLAGNFLILAGIFTIAYRFAIRPTITWFKNSMMVKLENVYERFVRFSLRGKRPVILFLSMIMLLFGSIGFYFGTNPTVIFFPENEPQYVNVFIEMPIGTDIEETNRITVEAEAAIRKVVEPYGDVIESVLAQVGKGTSDPAQGVTGSDNSPHKARIMTSFAEFQDRGGVSTARIMEEIRSAMNEIPGAIFTVDKDPVGPPVGKPINLEIVGEDYEELILLTDKVRRYMNSLVVPGVEGLMTDLEDGRPEIMVNVNRDAARRYGLSTVQVAMEIRTALFGNEIDKYKLGEEDYPIVVRNESASRHNLSGLLNQKITFQDMNTGQWLQVPISAVADITYTSGYGSVKRKDMNRVITIFSNVKDGYNANEIIDQYKQALSEYSMPDGFTYKFTGEQEEQEETMAFLTQALIIAIFLIFLVIVTQFNSISSPFIIMFTVLFSLNGVFLGLSIFNMPFVVLMTGIGIISLAGVVVNNAIVLIDYSMYLRTMKRAEMGIAKDDMLPYRELVNTLVNSGKTRLRPVLLTALTSILALFPMATGLNINFITLMTELDPNIYIGGDSASFWAPMSWTMIFGLSFATFLTLVLVPSMVLIADRMKRSFGRH